MTAKGIGLSFESIRHDPIAGRYRVEREIGRGGMATVYLCTDMQSGRPVALKILRPELGSAVVVDRFLREISFASELDHPQIPQVLDTGVIAELPFYVMTFIEGESLRSHLDKVKQLTIDEAVRIIREVIKPMSVAHERGIVHRDLKPANILLSGRNVYVLDFGVARAIMASADESLTSTGVAVGTPSYMSPEQALAEHSIDTRSDIYSLGCVAYEMIAGIPPFVGATAQSVMSRRFIAPPPPLHEARESVPANVEAAIMKALAKAPADRWQTASEFGDALTAKPPSASIEAEANKLATRRKRWVYALVALAFVAAVALGVIASLTRRDSITMAQRDVQAWNIDGAKSRLDNALKKHPDDPEAELWLAQMMMLRGDATNDWAQYALRAADHSASLAPDDRQRATALSAYASKSSGCSDFEKLSGMRTSAPTDDFTAELALAECIVGDRVVVPNARSPSGYSFRSSYERAAGIYEGLLARYPESPGAYLFIVPRLEKVLWTNRNKLRSGSTEDADRKVFAAWPELVGDTLSFTPHPISAGAVVHQNTAAVDRVVERNLAKIEKLATDWTGVSPASPDAHETLSRVLETDGKLESGTPSAISEIELARPAADRLPVATGDDYLRKLGLASTHVRLLLKTHRFARAAGIADSARQWKSPVALTDSIAGVADAFSLGLNAVTGHVGRVIELQQKYVDQYNVRLQTTGEVRTLPVEIASDATRFSNYAAFGGPRDSIVAIMQRLNQSLPALVAPAQLHDVKVAILLRPLGWAAPSIGPSYIAELGAVNDAFSKAVAAVARRDLATARRYADSVGTLYAERAPGEVTMDAVLQYSWLRSAIGDSREAAAFLDNALRGLSRAPTTMLMTAAIPAALVRSMLLRASLARAMGDSSTEGKWKRAARELWGNGDSLILPMLDSR